ncbi:MAG TPA: DUF202 domain-containing protein [Steroidobacteraceae bacterium]
MIRNFSDHAANERTFLAWVRTAIAVMAFGFLLEKFDVFLTLAAQTLGGDRVAVLERRFGAEAGLSLIVLGTVIVAISAVRFILTARMIDSPKESSGPGSRFDLGLAALLVLLGCALFVYVSRAFLTTP